MDLKHFYFYIQKEIPGHSSWLQDGFLNNIQNINPEFIFPGYFFFRSQQFLPLTYLQSCLFYDIYILVEFNIQKFRWFMQAHKTTGTHKFPLFTSKCIKFKKF